MFNIGEKLEHSLEILSLKNFMNEEAGTLLEEKAGSIGEGFLERSVFNEDHKLFGLFLALEISSLKSFS